MASYVKRVLLPGEQVLYWGRVTWVMYLPGILLCLLAIWTAKVLPGADERSYTLHRLSRSLSSWLPVEYTAELIIYGLFAVAIALILRAYVICSYTELAVTDRRVIAKMGVTNVVTTEIDRHKIAGVIIQQGIYGMMFGYGKIVLRGYSGHIGGLPPLSKPYELQKVINARVRPGAVYVDAGM